MGSRSRGLVVRNWCLGDFGRFLKFASGGRRGAGRRSRSRRRCRWVCQTFLDGLRRVKGLESR